MKKWSTILATCTVATVLFAQCKKKDSTVFNAGFYTTRANGPVSLYVDGSHKGTLPYFSEEPACGTAAGDGALPLTLQLPAGEYQVVGRDNMNAVISSARVYISTDRNGARGSVGGQRMSNNGTCVMIGLF